MALHYGVKQVLVMDLLEEPDRNLVDLCGHHAERLKAPLGWNVVDQRTVMSPALEASGL
jgi:hypothetical protein